MEVSAPISKVASLKWSKRSQVVLFSSTAIALYGYDQGMMSLINTNFSYLNTMGIAETDPLVGVIVAVYYLGCSVGAVIFSEVADRWGRKKAIFVCLAIASLGNFIMFIAGLGGMKHALEVFFIGRIVMGLGVGGIDSVIPVYSSELSSDEARGKALAQEFQMNIFGLNMAFGVNLGVTRALGKTSQWAWRTPIVVMQAYPVMLLAVIGTLPESPRWLLFHGQEERSKSALEEILGEKGDEEEESEADKKFEELKESYKQESDNSVSYRDMFTPSHPQFHPTIITIMVQVNQVRPIKVLKIHKPKVRPNGARKASEANVID